MSEESIERSYTKRPPPIHVYQFACAAIIGHQHEDDLRHLLRRTSASSRQDGGPVLDDRITLRAVGGVEQGGIHQTQGDGVDTYQRQLPRQDQPEPAGAARDERRPVPEVVPLRPARERVGCGEPDAAEQERHG